MMFSPGKVIDMFKRHPVMKGFNVPSSGGLSEEEIMRIHAPIIGPETDPNTIIYGTGTDPEDLKRMREKLGKSFNGSAFGGGMF